MNNEVLGGLGSRRQRQLLVLVCFAAGPLEHNLAQAPRAGLLLLRRSRGRCSQVLSDPAGDGVWCAPVLTPVTLFVTAPRAAGAAAAQHATAQVKRCLAGQAVEKRVSICCLWSCRVRGVRLTAQTVLLLFLSSLVTPPSLAVLEDISEMENGRF